MCIRDRDSKIPIALTTFLSANSQIKTIVLHLDNDKVGRLCTATLKELLQKDYKIDVYKRQWYWWSRGFGGYSALDYLIKVKEYDFVEAVEILTGQTMAAWKPPPAPKKDEPKVLLLPPKNKDCNRVIQYLFGRGMDYQLIQECIADGTLYERDVYKRQVSVGGDFG